MTHELQLARPVFNRQPHRRIVSKSFVTDATAYRINDIMVRQRLTEEPTVSQGAELASLCADDLGP